MDGQRLDDLARLHGSMSRCVGGASASGEGRTPGQTIFDKRVVDAGCS